MALKWKFSPRNAPANKITPKAIVIGLAAYGAIVALAAPVEHKVHALGETFAHTSSPKVAQALEAPLPSPYIRQRLQDQFREPSGQMVNQGVPAPLPSAGAAQPTQPRGGVLDQVRPEAQQMPPQKAKKRKRRSPWHFSNWGPQVAFFLLIIGWITRQFWWDLFKIATRNQVRVKRPDPKPMIERARHQATGPVIRARPPTVSRRSWWSFNAAPSHPAVRKGVVSRR